MQTKVTGNLCAWRLLDNYRFFSTPIALKNMGSRSGVSCILVSSISKAYRFKGIVVRGSMFQSAHCAIQQQFCSTPDQPPQKMPTDQRARRSLQQVLLSRKLGQRTPAARHSGSLNDMSIWSKFISPQMTRSKQLGPVKKAPDEAMRLWKPRLFAEFLLVSLSQESQEVTKSKPKNLCCPHS